MNWNPFKSRRSEQEPIPSVLYKFVGPDKCHHWLERRTVAFPSLRKLNDPYESLILQQKHSGAGAVHLHEDVPVRWIRIGMTRLDAINPDYDPNARPRRIANEQAQNAALAQRHAQQGFLIDELGILSLTRSAKSMTMWAHYAGNSQGLCFGIDWRQASLLDANGTSASVDHDTYVLSLNYEGAPAWVQNTSNREFVTMALGRKHTDWAYEREVRLLRSLRTFARKSGDNGIGLVELNPASLKEIIVGVMPDDSVLEMLKRNWSTFSHASLGQLQLQGSGYEPTIAALKHPDEVKRPQLFPLARTD